MSLNDKVQVLWKTNCEWRDKPHWPKRREIKLREGETEGLLLPLNQGELVKIKFGSRWYDAEIVDAWTPKSKKGKKSPATVEVPATAPAAAPAGPGREESADHPYRQFLAEQQKRQLEWKSQRAAKKSKTCREQPEEVASERGDSNPRTDVVTDQPSQKEVDKLRKQLDATTEECTNLKRQLEKAKEANAEAVKQELKAREDFNKILTRMQDTLEAMEEKMDAAFSRFDSRLESLEGLAVNSDNMFGNTINYGVTEVVDTSSLVSESSESSLSADNLLKTIDVEALRQVCDETIRKPQQPSPNCSLTASPKPPSCNPTEAELEVREGLISTCVTPTRARGIKQIMDNVDDCHKCALKLLPHFFSKEQLSKSNTDGSFGKDCLDPAKLNSLKILLFSKFPVYSPSQKDKIWREVKSKINAKCRASKFAKARVSHDFRDT